MKETYGREEKFEIEPDLPEQVGYGDLHMCETLPGKSLIALGKELTLGICVFLDLSGLEFLQPCGIALEFIHSHLPNSNRL